MGGVEEMSYDRIGEAVESGDKIGEGAYGIVYKCCLSDGRTVAVKMVGDEVLARAQNNAEDQASIERMFMAEVNTLGHLRHPNVVRLLGYSRGTGGQRALVYELLAGGSLHDRIHDDTTGMLMAGQRISIALDIARGLLHLHGLPPVVVGGGENAGSSGSDEQKHTLHRDVKSGNVALDENDVGKLIDCGLAKAVSSNTRSLLSITDGATLGTPGYIAPEVTSGKYGVPSDIYSLGVVFLELLTSQRAAAGRGLVATLRRAMSQNGRDSFLASFAEQWADPKCGWVAGDAFDQLRDLSLHCVEEWDADRPANMTEIVVRLYGIQQSWSAEHGGSSAAEVAPSGIAASVTLEDYRQLEVKLERARATIQELQTGPHTPPAVEEATATCCLTLEEVPVSTGILCESGHIASDENFDKYVRSKNDGIVVDRPEVGRVVDLAALQRTGRPDGAIYCPRCTGGEHSDCTAPAYSDHQIAQHVTGETFSQYVEVKKCVAERGVYDRAQTELRAEINRINRELGQQNVQVSKERLRRELLRQFPSAYQCGGCGHGPIDHMACSTLTTHHEEGGINNACRVCGWFRPDIKQWPRWNGNLPAGVDATTGAAVRAQLPGGRGGVGSSASTESDYEMALRVNQELNGEGTHPATQNLRREQVFPRPVFLPPSLFP
jgi:serine/threonine protein kinase